jgi:hypothetical protein
MESMGVHGSGSTIHGSMGVESLGESISSSGGGSYKTTVVTEKRSGQMMGEGSSDLHSSSGGGSHRTTMVTERRSGQVMGGGSSDLHSSSGGGSHKTTMVTERRSGQVMGGGSSDLHSSSGVGSYKTTMVTERRSGQVTGGESSDIHYSESGMYGSDSSGQMMARMMNPTGEITQSGGGSYSKVVTTSTSSTSSKGSTNLVPKQQYLYESLSSSDSKMTNSGQGSSQVVMETGEDGKTQMKIIRNVETTYVGSTPVLRSSNVVLRTPDSKNYLYMYIDLKNVITVA